MSVQWAQNNPLLPSYDFRPDMKATVAVGPTPAVVETNPLHPRFDHAQRTLATREATAQRGERGLSLAATRRLLQSYEGAAFEVRRETNPLHPSYDFHPHVAASDSAGSVPELARSPLQPSYYAARSPYNGATRATYAAVAIPLNPLDPRYALRMQ